MKSKDKKIGLIILSIMIVIFIYIKIKEVYIENQLEDSKITYAIVTNVGVISYRGLIDYEYSVDGNQYSGGKTIKLPEDRNLSDEELEKINDLKIKYAINSPWLSEIIDDRIK